MTLKWLRYKRYTPPCERQRFSCFLGGSSLCGLGGGLSIRHSVSVKRRSDSVSSSLSSLGGLVRYAQSN